MDITIKYNNKDFLIEVDGNQFTAVRLNTNQSKGKNFGQQTKIFLGHYTKLAHAIRKIIQEEMASSEEQISLIEFIKRYEDATKEILDQTKNI